MAEEGGGATIDDYDFSGVTAGASDVYPSEAGQIKKGGFIMIKGRPCKVVNVSTSKTGKHGHAKANFTAIDIFNGKKVEDVVPTTHTTYVPNVRARVCVAVMMDRSMACRFIQTHPTGPPTAVPDPTSILPTTHHRWAAPSTSCWTSRTASSPCSRRRATRATTSSSPTTPRASTRYVDCMLVACWKCGVRARIDSTPCSLSIALCVSRTCMHSTLRHPPPQTKTKTTQEILNAFKEGKSLTVTVLSACGIDQVIAYKEDTSA